MCGIVGYVGRQNAVPLLLEGLRRLEYRGYDSAGIAFLEKERLLLKKRAGRLENLEALLSRHPYRSPLGIGHTRWATHGRPSDRNAHPHLDCTGRVAVVHNGIIENYLSLRQRLTREGHHFRSDTDTEVVAHLIESSLNGDLEGAVLRALSEVEGSYAIAVISSIDPETVLAARQASPLVIGVGEGEYFLASDIPAFLRHTREVLVLDDREIACVRSARMKVTRVGKKRPVHKKTVTIGWSPAQAEKGGYRHFMLKEIHEQPSAIEETLRGRISARSGEITLPETNLSRADLARLSRITLIACGSSYHAALVGKYLFENLAGVPVEADIASEFRYRSPSIDRGTLTIAISQSGETADTIAAVKEASARGSRTLALCNVVGSSLTRLSDGVLPTHAGPEIGVAATKTFTCQLVALSLLALSCGRARGTISKKQASLMAAELAALPRKVDILLRDTQCETVARQYGTKPAFLYLGRGINYPIALEGALKLKEIAYIHAEGYAAGEMKHGPIALIEKETPVVVLAPRDHVYEKMIGNIEEVRAREGAVIALATEGDSQIAHHADHVITIPRATPVLVPILLTIPLQLLAYSIAIHKGCDVDRPRNLAKSVTVE